MKKLPETDAIFETIHQINQAADADETVLRISCDAKATILLERFARGGLSRLTVKALDHDFQDKESEKVTPYGLYLWPLSAGHQGALSLFHAIQGHQRFHG